VSAIVVIEITEQGRKADAILDKLKSQTGYVLDRQTRDRFEVWLPHPDLSHEQGSQTVKQLLDEIDAKWGDCIDVLPSPQ
jgi:hypothetical protein